MPELPEVETIVGELIENQLVGDTISKMSFSFSKVLQNISEQDLQKKLTHAKILNIYRRGKWIVFVFKGFILGFHLRMTGKLWIQNQIKDFHKHERAKFFLGSKRALVFEDQRKFGRIYYSEEKDPFPKLGMEPFSLTFNAKTLKTLFGKSKRTLKAFLLDQTKIAGLGNIYVDEALFASKLHPQEIVNRLTLKEVERLKLAIQEVLKTGIENSGTTLGNHRSNYASTKGKGGSNQNRLKVFRKDGKPCLVCGSLIVKIRVATRGTHFCPHCQKIK